MNTYYTIDEKYLKAVDKINWKTHKALQLFTDIINNDPLYAKAHYQLGKIYYYDLEDHQAAGYHFKTCMELEPTFPGNYYHYLHLVVFLNMQKLVKQVAGKALTVPGVIIADIHELLGLFAEKNQQLENALAAYNSAFDTVTDDDDRKTIGRAVERVTAKIQSSKAYKYHLTE